MRYFALDTSALSKRYHLERGTPWMMNLFEQAFNSLPERLVISRMIIAEVVWVLKRRLNTHTLDQTSMNDVLNKLERESHLMSTLNLDDDTIDAAHPIILRHNLNSSDAIFLYQCTQAATALRQFGNELVLIASDSRLLRAASGEGLAVLNPETDDQTGLEI